MHVPPKKIFDEIGLFNPTFFACHEELDLGWRATHFFQVNRIPGAPFSVSTAIMVYYCIRNIV